MFSSLKDLNGITSTIKNTEDYFYKGEEIAAE
jgi:hypothetical protein